MSFLSTTLSLQEICVLRWTVSSMILIALAFMIFKWIQRRMALAGLKKMSGPEPNFFMGNLLGVYKMYRRKFPVSHSVVLTERLIGTMVLFQKKGMYLFWFANTPIVSIFSPSGIEAVLSSSVSLDKSWEYRFLHPWLGLGLLTSTGSKWRTRRRILTPAFHFRILEDFLPVFNEQSLVLVKKLQRLADQEWVDITPMVVLCTLDIVSESVMGIHIGAQDNSDSEYVQAIHRLGNYFNRRTARPWVWPDFFFYMSEEGRDFKRSVKILHNFTRQVIKERKLSMVRSPKEPKKPENSDKESYITGRKRKAFMDLLLDLHIEEHLMTEEDIREEVDTFMFEGHDTTAMGISWALYCIGLYSHIQKKIVEELDSIFSDDRERPITHDDIRQMKYLECVLKESQRIYPSVPLIGRVLNEEITLGGVVIPKQTVIHLHIIGLHRNPEIFPNPDVFDPERFFPENSVNRNPYAFVPFSAGPRNCIGQKFALMEEKAVIANLLRNFEITSLDPRDKVHVKIEFVLRPDEPLRLKFTPRRQ